MTLALLHCDPHVLCCNIVHRIMYQLAPLTGKQIEQLFFTNIAQTIVNNIKYEGTKDCSYYLNKQIN